VTPASAPRATRSAAGSDAIVNAMSVDVEDYFQVSAFESTVSRNDWERMESRVDANTRRLLDIFDEFGVRSTFFCLGWVAERQPALVREIVARGHELASHGQEHRLIYDQTPETFRQDIRRAKTVLEDTSGVRVYGYRAPSYSVTAQSLWALDVLAEEGYTYDSSIFPIRHDRYGIPSAPRHIHVRPVKSGELVEVPGSTVQLGSTNLPVGGGGYFRILPYWWTRWGIQRVNEAERRPAIFYLHPWEIDPAQPRIPAGRLSHFRHYRNLAQTETRLRRLLADFRFDTMAALLERTAPLTDTTSARPRES
jgi:polysaccharide deacetylase family protein (PEP-CTERM system associated)